MLKITFTESGKRQDWTGGRNWGICLYVDGTDPAATFMVKLLREAPPSTPVGPNPVLPDQGTNVVWPPKPVQSPHPSTHKPIQTPCPTTRPPSPPVLKVAGSLHYKGMAIMSSYSVYTTAPLGCTSPPENSMTLSEVSGKGLCLGNVPTTYQALCHIIEKPSAKSYYLAAPSGAYWACGTGLTPCVSSALLNSDYCILIKLWSATRTISPPDPAPKTIDRLFNLVRGAYLALNAFNPNFTRGCWLCLSAEPPNYEGIAVSANISN